MRRATRGTFAELPCLGISIHALHEESDLVVDFLQFGEFVISIHALHEESDAKQLNKEENAKYFNPRSP